MKTTHIAVMTSLALSTLFVTACHENPMNSHNKKHNVAFLREAAISAEHCMKLPARKGGRFYSNCMETNKEQIDCTRLFSEMLRFAQTKEGYTSLTYKELTNPQMYAAIAEDYQSKLFNTLNY